MSSAGSVISARTAPGELKNLADEILIKIFVHLDFKTRYICRLKDTGRCRILSQALLASSRLSALGESRSEQRAVARRPCGPSRRERSLWWGRFSNQGLPLVRPATCPSLSALPDAERPRDRPRRLHACGHRSPAGHLMPGIDKTGAPGVSGAAERPELPALSLLPKRPGPRLRGPEPPPSFSRFRHPVRRASAGAAHGRVRPEPGGRSR